MMKLYLLLAFSVLLISLDVAFAAGNNGNGKGNGNNGNGKGNGNNGGNSHKFVSKKPVTGQELCECESQGSCFGKILECPDRIPSNMNSKGCYVDCSSKCETSCRSRKPSCDGYGAVCYDPRFIGGDGRMFYFHGSKGGDFALFSDDDLCWDY